MSNPGEYRAVTDAEKPPIAAVDAAYPPTPPDKALYATGVQLRTSLFEIIVKFSVKHPNGESSLVCDMHLSPTSAMLLYAVLENHLATYEKQFGKIPVPDAIYTSLGAKKPELRL